MLSPSTSKRENVSHWTSEQRLSSIIRLNRVFHLNAQQQTALRWENNTQEKELKKITLRWFMKYNWDFWKYCSPTQGLTFTERRPRSEFLWLYNKCYTMFCFSTGVSKLIWGKHSYSITKSWFILSSLGFKAQTIPFFKPNPLYITISLQVNYKSHLYPTPSIPSLLLQIRRWTILKDKSWLAQLMSLSISFTYERILNLVSSCSYLQK